MARKILLADDSVTAQNMGRKILADAGYEVLTVNNGSAALKKIAEAKPELIVLDVYMPGYSGLEVCQRLKEAQETSRIPVLLTVGKLEPFKPEEAKRVRADGYIVKPFEASELLSALSKLEDKIVPGREASKPGRFARANAALDEGRYDKSMAIEEDSSWKSRIAFPSKKKKAAEEEVEDPAVYNPVNKDLRTVADRKSGSKPETKAEEPRVNLEALAPEGLPKDVTPEEIAALAAAAAQVQGKIADSKVAEPVAEIVAPEVKAVEAKHPEVEAKAVEAKSAEAQADALPATNDALPVKAETAAPVASVEKPEAEKPAEVSKDADRVPSPSSAEVIAAISALERDADKSRTDSGSASSSHEPTAEPVTMAAAAGAAYASAPSRWTAVSVALAADEAALSLEQEMHQAHAAIVGAGSARVESPATLAEPTPAPAAEVTNFEKVSAETAIAEPATVEPPTAKKTFEAHPVSAEPASVAEPSAPISAAVPELIAPTTPEPTPVEPAVAAHELNDASSIGAPSTDAITAAVKELEAAAAAYEAQRSAASEPAAQAVESVSPAPEPTQTVEAVSRHEDIPAETTQPVLSQEVVATADQKAHVDLRHEEQAQEEEKHEIPAPVAEIATAAPEQAPAVSDEKPEIEAPIHAAEVSPEAASHVAAHSDESAPVPSGARGKSDPANKEPDIAESTAAAWASWRRIRESGDGKSAKANSKDQSASRDEAAMAVAAGAEKSPDASASDAESGEIDSIVDSVLADLRPKIVEEISRKLGKKK